MLQSSWYLGERKSSRMADDSLIPTGKQTPSFKEFKKLVLEHGADEDFLNRVANSHGKIPRLIRILHNFDPTGTASAIDQIINEEKSEREQENILRAIYALAVKIWKVDETEVSNLPDDKFKFLYVVYVKSETDIFARVNTDEIQSLLALPQSRILSIGEYLDRNKLISFDNWYQGIGIMHKGIIRVETHLLGNNEIPEYVSLDEIKKIEDRVRQRFHLLQYLNQEAEEDTFNLIPHAELARKAGLEHSQVIRQLLPYIEAEDWIRSRTADSVSITEEGIDRVKALLSQKRMS
jgi:hypothetical protein